ncbi:hypothetical protein LIER_09102 [Lithospermum erythrorhizon]|uniref:Uncharacterized protein n=1 Tax=Lithospermum erythrorhizon TaxID=34254 RepID=A0AAV3PEB8_LITER
MYFTQMKYIRDIVSDLKMKVTNAVATLLPHDWFVYDEESLLSNSSVYKSLCYSYVIPSNQQLGDSFPKVLPSPVVSPLLYKMSFLSAPS